MTHGRGDELAAASLPARRVRASVLAWMLGVSVAALAAMITVEIADFRRQVDDLSDRIALLDRVSTSRTLVRGSVLLAMSLYPGGGDVAADAVRRQLHETFDQLRRTHQAVVGGEVEPGRRIELPTSIAEVYYGTGHELDRRVRDYLDAGGELLAESDAEAPRDRMLLVMARLANARSILDRYDEAVSLAVASLHARVQELRSLRYARFLVGHLLLVAWIAFLYQWMLRQLRDDNRRHRELHSRAEKHAQELDTALEGLTRSHDEARVQSLAMLSILEDLRAERGRLDAEVVERTRAEERFRAMFEASPVGKILVSRTGTIQMANSVAERLFGYEHDELVGHAVEEFVPDRVREVHPMHRKGFLRSPSARPMGAGRHLSARRKDGSEVPVEIALSPIVTDHGPAVLTSVIDITERTRAESAVERANRELSRKNEELEQFVYTVSHDLKSPMVTISGFVGHIASDAKKLGHTGILDAAARVERACGKLRETLDHLLELSRAGRTVHEPKRLELRDVVARVLEEQGAVLEGSKARVEVGELPRIDADPLRIVEVFGNLLTNAIRHGSDGEPSTIRIGSERAGGEARVYVEDEGPGIPAEFRERVFGLFVRLPSPVTGPVTGQAASQVEGSGVGLAIVKRIVEAHGGRVWIESPPAGRSRGTRVWVAFPDPLVATWQRRASTESPATEP